MTNREFFMLYVRGRSLLAVLFFSLGLFVSAGEAKKKLPLVREITLSAPNMANSPALVASPEGELFATWQNIENKNLETFKSFFAIARYDMQEKAFRAPFKAFPIDVGKNVGLWDNAATRALMAESGSRNSMPVFLMGYQSRNLVVITNFPPILFGRLEPDLGKKTYGNKVLGTIIDVFEVVQGWVPGTMALIYWPPDRSKKNLMYIASAGDRIWSYQSQDCGKTWSKPKIIAEGKTSGLMASAAVAPWGEIIVFCARNVTELKMVRSKDGLSWSKPEVFTIPNTKQKLFAFDPYDCSYFIGKDETIWLAYSSRLKGSKRSPLFLTCSKDRGKSWARPIQLTKGDHRDDYPTVGANDKEVLILFERYAKGKEDERKNIYRTIMALAVDRESLHFEFEPKAKKEKEKKRRDQGTCRESDCYEACMDCGFLLIRLFCSPACFFWGTRQTEALPGFLESRGRLGN
jgi:hypothetical protein